MKLMDNLYHYSLEFKLKTIIVLKKLLDVIWDHRFSKIKNMFIELYLQGV